MKISKDVRNDFIKNLEGINESLEQDQFNTILNYSDKFNINNEITLIIHADFERMSNVLKNSILNNNRIRKDISLGKRRYSTKSTVNNNLANNLENNFCSDNSNLNLTIEQKVFKLTEILRINKEFVGDVSVIEEDLINIFKLLLLFKGMITKKY